MPWTQAKASSAGTKNPIVARLFIQAHDTLEQCGVKRGDKGKILAQCGSPKTRCSVVRRP